MTGSHHSFVRALASKESAVTIRRHVSSGAGVALARSRRAAGAGIAGPITGQDPSRNTARRSYFR